MSTFKERVLSLFPELKTIAQVAEKIEISQMGLSKIFKNGHIPKAETLLKIHEKSGCDLKWLMTGEGQPFPSPLNNQATVKDTEHTTDIMGNPVDLEDFVFIPQYETITATSTHSENPAEPEDETKYPVAFRRAWLKRNVPVDFDKLSVISVKGDSMEGVLNDRDTILINHTQQSPADGVYVIRMGNDLLVKRTQVLPHNRLKVLSENQSYEPFEVDLNERNLDFKLVGRVEACFHRL